MRVSLLAAVDLFFAGLCSSSLSRSVLSLSRAFSLSLFGCVSFFPFVLSSLLCASFRFTQLQNMIHLPCGWELSCEQCCLGEGVVARLRRGTHTLATKYAHFLAYTCQVVEISAGKMCSK